MPAALLPPRGWAEIRTASEAGVTDRELSERYEVSEESIRKQRQRNKWLTPQAVEKERIRLAQNGGLSNLSPSSMSRQSRNERKKAGKEGAIAVVAENLTTLAEEGSLHFQKLAHRAITSKKRLHIDGVSDAVSLVKTMRTVAGIDKDGGVQINVGSWGAAATKVEVHELGD